MTEATTLVVTATPDPEGRESMQAYLEGVLPLLLGAGGQVVKRLRVQKTLNGSDPYQLVLVMDFASKEALADLFESAEYRALVPHREQGFESMTIAFAETL